MSPLPTQGPGDQPAAVRAFMRGLIDYAGLFPPSELPLGEAIESFANYRVGADAWMMSRFIIPAAKLEKLDEYTDNLFTERPPFRFSVIARGSNDLNDFLIAFRSDLVRMKAFQQQHGNRVSIDLIETKLPVPPGLPLNPEVYLPFFETVERAVLDDLGKRLPVYFEVPWQTAFHDDFASDCDDLFDHATDAMSLYNSQPVGDRILVGLKLRCGGVKPEMVPEPDVVASALFHTARRKVPFKATAGLHHPMRHFREEFGGMMHGFLNVFGAGLLAREHKLSRELIEQIIREEDPAAFTISDTEFAWGDYRCDLQELTAGRTEQFHSYGSCSFDEPREDLVALGLLK